MSLTRDLCGATCTLGELYIDGVFECYTLEDAVRAPGEKIPGRTAIPEGRYQVVITPSPRFKRPLPLLLKVPMFEGIRIHPGNSAEDTEGCILPGTRRGDGKVFDSRGAFDALYEKIQTALHSGEEVWLEVVNA